MIDINIVKEFAEKHQTTIYKICKNTTLSQSNLNEWKNRKFEKMSVKTINELAKAVKISPNQAFKELKTIEEQYGNLKIG